MFKRATKAELKTWMLGDLFIEVLLIFFSFNNPLSTYIKNFIT